MLHLAATATFTAATPSNHPIDGHTLHGPLLSLAVHALPWLLLALLLWVPYYLLTCWTWPFANCRRCGGLGKRLSPSGRTFRECPRCGGSGSKLRAGRYLINHLLANRRTARRHEDRRERQR
ncbi:hypothetical protein [Fodinicola feengrottensis]|uniref:hypothetical protein n=2 Tax=Fodinicola feengrottensis TaxID=435914 RepID=UPI0024413F66|nr:hypothetical protein [Fodinicola feengrottensis]